MNKAEERALEAYPYDYPERTGFRQGYEQAEKDLLSFINSLPEEKPSEDLEEATYKYSFESRPSIYGQVDVIDAFKAGQNGKRSR